MEIFFQIVYTTSLCGMAIGWVLGIIYEIIGPVKFAQILESLGIHISITQIWLIFAIMLVLLIISYIVKTKL